MPMLDAVLAGAIGAMLGIRFKVTVLFPATIVVALVALITGANAPTGRTVLAIFLAMSTLQVGYLGGAGAQHCWSLRHHRAAENSRESPRPARGPVA